MRKVPAVADQLICHLVDDESRAVIRSKTLVHFLEQIPFLRRFQDAERDAGNDVVTVRFPGAGEGLRKGRSVGVEDNDPWLRAELTLKMRGEILI